MPDRKTTINKKATDIIYNNNKNNAAYRAALRYADPALKKKLERGDSLTYADTDKLRPYLDKNYKNAAGNRFYATYQRFKQDYPAIMNRLTDKDHSNDINPQALRSQVGEHSVTGELDKFERFKNADYLYYKNGEWKLGDKGYDALQRNANILKLHYKYRPGDHDIFFPGTTPEDKEIKIYNSNSKRDITEQVIRDVNPLAIEFIKWYTKNVGGVVKKGTDNKKHYTNDTNLPEYAYINDDDSPYSVANPTINLNKYYKKVKNNLAYDTWHSTEYRYMPGNQDEWEKILADAMYNSDMEIVDFYAEEDPETHKVSRGFKPTGDKIDTRDFQPYATGDSKSKYRLNGIYPSAYGITAIMQPADGESEAVRILLPRNIHYSNYATVQKDAKLADDLTSILNQQYIPQMKSDGSGFLTGKDGKIQYTKHKMTNKEKLKFEDYRISALNNMYEALGHMVISQDTKSTEYNK